MADAKLDANHFPTLTAVSNLDGVTPVVLWADPTTHRLLISSLSDPGGSDTQVQFNDGGSFGGNAGLTFDKTTGTLGLGSGGIINFNSSDVTITHSANLLTIAGGDLSLGTNTLTVHSIKGDATDGLILEANNGDDVAILGPANSQNATFFGSLSVVGAVLPTVDNTPALGASGQAWSDLFLGSGAVINFNAGDVTLTHGANVLTLAGGDLALGANNLTMTGSLAATGARVTKGWFTDIESTNMITIGGTSLLALTNTWSVLQTFSVAGNTARFVNTSDSASVQVAIFEGDRATMADNDEAYISLRISNDGGTQTEIARLTWVGTDVNAATNVDGRINFAVMTAGSLANVMSLTGNGLFPATNDGLSLGAPLSGWSDLYLATGGNILINGSNAKRTLILTAAGGSPTTTIGCGGPTKVEAGTNDIDYWALEFDTTTEERAFWNVQMPDNWDGSTVTAIFVWTNAAGLTTETVRWGIKARAYADDAAIDQAYGTEVTVDDTWLAQGDVHISAATSAITIGGSPAGGQWVVFNVGRKVASDNLTGDARLMMVKIEYGINAYSD